MLHDNLITIIHECVSGHALMKACYRQINLDFNSSFDDGPLQQRRRREQLNIERKQSKVKYFSSIWSFTLSGTVNLIKCSINSHAGEMKAKYRTVNSAPASVKEYVAGGVPQIALC